MKKLGLLLSFLILLSAFTCEDEPLEGDFVTDDAPSATSCVEAIQNTGDAANAFAQATNNNYSALCNAYINALEDQLSLCGDDTGAIQTLIDSLGDCTSDPDPGLSSDYWPRSIGNSWDFSSTTFGDYTMQMNSIENIDGNDYYKIDNYIQGTTAWLRKSGSNYHARQVLGGFDLPGYEVTTTPIEIIILDDEAEVGDTWTDDVTYTVSYVGTPTIPDIVVSATYNFEMIARNISREVNGTTYDNVLHVRLELVSTGTTEIVNYYYAKDIGPIEYNSSGDLTTLNSYSLN